ncbi:hypothetical protein J7E96_06205 [Streptomyces sp. ISL-96]|uniref:hypothetical protein n=1 Tax=Streptomyces sp. ISL-96 TaxID=2819191 RepID=UPI001BE92893|nr:hypothetical protein [Streptomyces sp. ISL-96]MBT2488125.1 hypothetical protein [Streptomyces sp. ISL-96]
MEISGSRSGSPSTATHRPSQELSAGPPAVRSPGAEPCDLVTVPVRQGLEAVDIIRRASAPAVGPVLHDGPCATLGFLVPPGTADGWDMPGSACTQTSGRGLRIPSIPSALSVPSIPSVPAVLAGDIGADSPPLVPEPPLAGSGWLLPPTDTGPVTDPAVLRAALGEAARLIEAADRVR